jgi:hypothetical protein
LDPAILGPLGPLGSLDSGDSAELSQRISQETARGKVALPIFWLSKRKRIGFSTRRVGPHTIDDVSGRFTADGSPGPSARTGPKAGGRHDRALGGMSLLLTRYVDLLRVTEPVTELLLSPDSADSADTGCIRLTCNKRLARGTSLPDCGDPKVEFDGPGCGPIAHSRPARCVSRRGCCRLFGGRLGMAAQAWWAGSGR